ncbi:cytoskeletal protein CcmA (bactofilin family) [Dysgonomonas alginatilytica]|uniref:Cytoskeletal protein CcmA (Bactofilin family) n=1 Tax=Dysgonomonas alginatilytica TaxID=1605892 RepID=A0A2V3PQ05_9BACT|nr:polymer-forming cytoskeletal protein [Dysgonomonas alginatilytica]PXV58864.1 cytoskeletal protein CcmA (bactofilin family) [Dysgonomonas alginatilytica]
MWNIAKRKNNSTMVEYSCFSASVIIEGNLNGNDNIRIDGIITGNISCSAKIVVGQKGIVTGDINCAEIEVSGSLTGNVQVTELLLLHANSTYQGNALVKEIQIEPGAVFFGTCKMPSSRSARIGDEPGHHLMNILTKNKDH